ncbi:MAG: hypothetical protein WA728_13600 [Xanthobacteraceae bacterium]
MPTAFAARRLILAEIDSRLGGTIDIGKCGRAFAKLCCVWFVGAIDIDENVIFAHWNLSLCVFVWWNSDVVFANCAQFGDVTLQMIEVSCGGLPRKERAAKISRTIQARKDNNDGGKPEPKHTTNIVPGHALPSFHFG